MMYRFVLLLTLVSSPLSAETQTLPPPLSALKMTCAGCHRDTGSQTTRSIPSLKKLTPQALESKLIAYKDNRLQGTVMNRISQGLSLDNIHNLSQSFLGAP
jgi:cytochrome c553